MNTTLRRMSGKLRMIEGRLVKRALRPNHMAAKTSSTGRDAVYLTFDDGPDATFTPELIEVLDRADAKATFYMTATNASREPELVREMDRRGHTIGSHSKSHLQGWSSAPHSVARDLLAGHREIEAILGHSVRHFRPPYGHLDLGVLAFCASQKLTPMLWSSDPEDWQVESTAEEVVERSLPDLKPGAVILLHDAIFDNPHAADRTHTVQAVERLLDTIDQRQLVAAAL